MIATCGGWAREATSCELSDEVREQIQRLIDDQEDES